MDIQMPTTRNDQKANPFSLIRLNSLALDLWLKGLEGLSCCSALECGVALARELAMGPKGTASRP